MITYHPEGLAALPKCLTLNLTLTLTLTLIPYHPEGLAALPKWLRDEAYPQQELLEIKATDPDPRPDLCLLSIF